MLQTVKRNEYELNRIYQNEVYLANIRISEEFIWKI